MSAKLLGEFIQQKRAEKRMSLRDLAESAEISPSQLSKLERGLVKYPNSETITRLAFALNVDKDDLLALAGRIDIDHVFPFPTDVISDYSNVIIQALEETAAATDTIEDSAPLLDQLKDIAEYRNQELDDSEILFIAKEMEAAYELALRRIRNKKKLVDFDLQDWTVDFNKDEGGMIHRTFSF